jgi:hypothetical protein
VSLRDEYVKPTNPGMRKSGLSEPYFVMASWYRIRSKAGAGVWSENSSQSAFINPSTLFITSSPSAHAISRSSYCGIRYLRPNLACNAHLSKFWLSICSVVFVSEAFGKLHIPVDTACHQKLLILLRALR